MEDFVYYTELFDLYEVLLTSKQKVYYKEYYFNNLSLKEISEKYDVSRNAVYKQVKNVKEILEDYEKKLKLRKKQEKIEKILNENQVEKFRDIIYG